MGTEKKSEKILLRLTPTDKKNASYHAGLMGISLNEYIARCIRLKRIVICENLPDMVYHLSKIGTNINQIAAIANINQYVSVNNVEEVKKLMKDCYAKFEEFLSFINEPEFNENLLSETLSDLTVAVKAINKRLQNIENHLNC